MNLNETNAGGVTRVGNSKGPLCFPCRWCDEAAGLARLDLAAATGLKVQVYDPVSFYCHFNDIAVQMLRYADI